MVFIMRKILALALIVLGSLGLLTGVASAGDKVTICHAAGRSDTTHYVTLTISENAVYKDQGGHFFENGTPQAGHEQDYFGACKTDVTTTTTVPATTSTTVGKTITPTTVGSDSPPPSLPPTAQRRASAVPVTELPHTGQGTAVLAGLGAALLLAGLILAVRYRSTT